MDVRNDNNLIFNDENQYPGDFEYDDAGSIYDEDVYSSRYDTRRMFNNRRYNNQRRFDDYRRYDDRYYQYPYCDRFGRCSNPIWWMFWPFFFF